MECGESQRKPLAHSLGATCAQEPTGPPQLQPDETLMKTEDCFLIYSGNSMKSPENRNKLRKEWKRHQMEGPPQLKSETISQSCEGQDTSIPIDSFTKPSSSRKERERNKAAMDADSSSLAQETKDAKNSRQGSEHSESSEKVKKHKKKKKQKSSQEILKSSPKHLGGGENDRRSSGEATSDQICDVTWRNDVISQRRRKHSMSLHQSHKSTCTPLSSPTTLPKIKRSTVPNGCYKTKAANGESDNSQDLFITQKRFASCHDSSGGSPPLGQKPASDLPYSLGSQNPPRFLLPFPLTSNSIDQSGTGSQGQVVHEEKATQTDDNFSYLALSSLVKKVKVFPPCSEKPLNLSLPFRIRAKWDGVNTSDDVIIVESRSTSVDPNSSRKSLFQKADEAKLIQSVLNSSYFFKGKGEPGIENPITPILRIKEAPKKKSRKSRVHSKKRHH